MSLKKEHRIKLMAVLNLLDQIENENFVETIFGSDFVEVSKNDKDILQDIAINAEGYEFNYDFGDGLKYRIHGKFYMAFMDYGDKYLVSCPCVDRLKLIASFLEYMCGKNKPKNEKIPQEYIIPTFNW